MNPVPEPSSDHPKNSPLSEFYGCRRDHPRQRWVAEVQVCWIKGDTVQEAVRLKTADISQSGVDLLSRNMVHKGQSGIIFITDGGAVSIVRAFVVRGCRYSASGRTHHVGIEWLSDSLTLPVVVDRDANGRPTLKPRPMGRIPQELLWQARNDGEAEEEHRVA